jgi:hypothetical protein
MLKIREIKEKMIADSKDEAQNSRFENDRTKQQLKVKKCSYG